LTSLQAARLLFEWVFLPKGIKPGADKNIIERNNYLE